ncbi:hypothetical protein BDF20DRAFT_997167 [Mycotypha africana]|uniref:uncharacterized protein n=1 Tax=Mycotypha africana TaxID=64632 RepID=UPI0023014FF2|nr:uncharacterized protein BDF20DRAFT_997167 [Mycotypha africana]KAI8991247.1 hypothetical protein BDF20DRAFT_997167 [Mycotypha africana]
MVVNHLSSLGTTKNVIQQLIERHAEADIEISDFIYTVPQYLTLMRATVATSAISIVCSFLIISAFLYLRLFTPKRANRISLRCVFMASIMNLFNAAFDILIVTIFGESITCRAGNIIVQFTRIMSGAFLATVGLNLVVVFVFNHSKSSARRLELYYYPCITVYGLIAIAVPLAEMARSPLNTQDNISCFYFIFYHQLFGYSSFSWMWFFGFLFFTVLLAVVSSCISLTKLMYEHRALINKFTHIASSSVPPSAADPFSNATIEFNAAEDNVIQQRVRYHSNIFMRVVTRCVIYSMVPLISNIWGFVFQLTLIHPRSYAPRYSLSMVDAIFKCLQGFFVAIVFFSDPAMTQFISDRWKLYKAKYIDDYSRIRKYSNGQIEVIPHSQGRRLQEQSGTSSPPLPAALPLVSKPLAAECKKTTGYLFFQTNLKDWAIHHENGAVYETIPMRRLSVPPSVYTRLYQQHVQQHGLPQQQQSTWKQQEHDNIEDIAYETDEGTTPTLTPNSSRKPSCCIPDPESTNHIFVPYKYPRLASAIHWTLVHCGVGNSNSNIKDQRVNQPQHLQKDDHFFSFNSIGSTATTASLEADQRLQEAFIDTPLPVHPLT